MLGTLLGVLIISQALYLSQIVSGVFLRRQTLQQEWDLLLVLIGVIALRGLLTWKGETLRVGEFGLFPTLITCFLRTIRFF